MILRLFNIFSFLFCILILSIDFWSINLFGMEGVYYTSVCILLLILLTLHLIQPTANILDDRSVRGLKIFFHLVLISVALFNFKLIYIISWGFGYMGTSTPPIFHLTIVANFLALISGVSVFVKKYRLRK